MKDCYNCKNKDYENEACERCIRTDDLDSTPSEWVPMIDMVNHPDHYMSNTGLETIDVIEAFTSDLKGLEAVCTANVLKYICRWKKKNGLQDLEKAQWYLNRLIEHVQSCKKQDKFRTDGIDALMYAVKHSNKENVKENIENE